MLADAAADACLLPTESDADATAVDAIANDNRFRIGLTLVPVLAPLVAFGTYDLVFAAFHELKTALRSWYAVDGGSLERELLIPVVNGVVNPAISIVLATLVAGTINSLRQRQIQIRTLLNQEACDVRLLQVALESVYRDSPDERRATLSILQQYVTRIIVESRSAAGARVSPTSESELDGLVRILAQDVSGGNNGGRFYDPFLFSMTGIVQSLNNARSARLAALQTNYPVVHWVILALLQVSVLTNFLIESDEAALQFLDSLQLHLLFTIVTGAGAAVAALCVDLSQPFAGNFEITQSVEQLYILREQMFWHLCSEDTLKSGKSEKAAWKSREEDSLR